MLELVYFPSAGGRTLPKAHLPHAGETSQDAAAEWYRPFEAHLPKGYHMVFTIQLQHIMQESGRVGSNTGGGGGGPWKTVADLLGNSCSSRV